MRPTRRDFLRLGGATAAGGILLSSVNPVSAHSKPSMDWDQADTSNFSWADRENDYDIRWYIVHVTQGSYEGTISWFNDPDANVSAHYVIENDNPASTTQMVDESDIAWHAGGQNYNDHSLGAEHEGFVDETIWNDAVYEKSGRIAQWAAETYNFPLRVRRYNVAPCDARDGNGGVIGHHQIPESDCGSNDHTDPGSTWNWGRFEGYLRRYHLDVWGHGVTNADLSVRDGPGTYYSRIDVAPEGTPGTITDGPVDSDGYRWYEVSYDEGVSNGWSAATWLLHSRMDIWHDTEPRVDLSVRDGPGTSYSRIDVAPAGTSGTIVDGPVDNEGWRWFKVDYGGGVKTGWSAGYYLNPVH